MVVLVSPGRGDFLNPHLPRKEADIVITSGCSTSPCFKLAQSSLERVGWVSGVAQQIE